MNNYVVGPSHVVRMQHALNSNCLPIKISNLIFVGMGGAPTWSDVLFNKLSLLINEQSIVHIVLGDYRFGNNIIGDGKDISNQDKAYINIHGQFISAENDVLMYDFFQKGIDKWISLYPKLNLIPWTLLMRRAENIYFQNHINSKGQYFHPIINEKEIIKKYCDASYIRCMEIPASMLRHFYIDTDLHPSTLGYMFLAKCILNNDPYESAYSSVKELKFYITDFFHELDINKKIVVTGTSIALASLRKVLPIEHCLEDLISFDENTAENVFEINLQSLNDIGDVDVKKTGRLRDVINFPWDYLGYETISTRHPDLNRLKPLPSLLPTSPEVEYFHLFKKDELFDIGEKLTPTLKGMLYILSLASNKSHVEKKKLIDECINKIYSFNAILKESDPIVQKLKNGKQNSTFKKAIFKLFSFFK